MREITQGDIRAAARVLLMVPENDWPDLMMQLLSEAHCADRYRRRLGRHHPSLGNGTLMTAALARAPGSALPVADSRYLVAMAAAIEAVLNWRAR